MKRNRFVSTPKEADVQTAYDRRWWTLAVMSLSLLVISMDNTILNVALPTISDDLGASSSQLQWIVDSYTLVFAGLLLAAGSLGDRFGRRRALRIGLVVFLAGSVAAAVAGSPATLIAGRALMGVGGAFIMPQTLSILTNVFPAEERPKAIGIWAAVSGLGIAFGPITGGVLIENLSWGWVFLINIPVAITALALSRPFVPESKDPSAPKLDPFGATLSFAGLTTLLWAIIEAGGDRGWTDSAVVSSFGLAAALLSAFVVWEMHAPSPMLDVRLFRDRRFSASAASITMVFFALFGTIFFLTQYLQSVLGYGPITAGAAFIPVSVGMVVASQVSARLTVRVGPRPIVAGGLALVAAGLALLSLAQADSGYGLIAAALAALGFGMGMAMTPATESLMSALPKENAGVGSAMNDAVRQVGGALGVAVLGSLLSSGYRGDMDAAVSGLPAGAGDAASEGVGGAMAVADKIGGPAGDTLAATAEQAFTNAMNTTVLIAAAAALIGSLLAAALLPSKKRAVVDETPVEPMVAEIAELVAA
jgi:EmrB/QacA subfamily drug resistance transporter